MVPPESHFAGVVGQTLGKRALLLLAVEPRLRGVLIAAPSGTGKRTLVGAFASLLGKLGPSVRDGGLVRVPLGVTEDRLLGGLSFEAGAGGQQWRCRQGLLAEADKRVLYVDNVNLMQDSSLRAIANALDSGRVRVEREGVSASHAAGFILVGSYDPVGGHPGNMIQARVGLLVDGSPRPDLEERYQVLRRVLTLQPRDNGSMNDCFEADRATSGAVRQARRCRDRVRVPDRHLCQLISTASRLGLEGNRPDWFAMLAARANAALAGRSIVSEEDIEIAARLVLLPRAVRVDPKENSGANGERQPTEKGRAESPPHRDPGSASDDRVTSGEGARKEIDPLPGEFPAEMTSHLPSARAALGRPGRSTDNRVSSRGRTFRTSPQPDQRRSIALEATLRSAAPWQLWRRQQRVAGNDRRRDRPSRREDAISSQSDSRMVIDASDLRFHRFRGKVGLLFIFVVDASGSMAVNRMAQAKGAMARLLQQAYVHRDQVALVRFSGDGAETLLPPTRSVQRAKRLVDALPAGGATPLAAGLLQALGVARSARLRSSPQPVLLILTDGRANRPASRDPVRPGLQAAAIQRELRLLGAEIGRDGLTAVVVDTRPAFLAGGEGEALADWIQARYLRLPRADKTALFRAVASLAEEVRGKGAA